jgi:hypothetical protein
MSREPAFTMEEFNELVSATLDRVSQPDLSLSFPIRLKREDSLRLSEGFWRSHSRARVACPQPTTPDHPARRRRTRTNSLPQSFFDVSPDNKSAHSRFPSRSETPYSFFDDGNPYPGPSTSRAFNSTIGLSGFLSRPFKSKTSPSIVSSKQSRLSPLPTPVRTSFADATANLPFQHNDCQPITQESSVTSFSPLDSQLRTVSAKSVEQLVSCQSHLVL